MLKRNWTQAGLLKKPLFYLILTAIWEAVFRANLWPEYMFPSAVGVAVNLFQGFVDNSYLIAIGISLKRVFAGYLLSLFIGLGLGLLIVRIHFLDETFRPLLLGLQTLPVSAGCLWLFFGSELVKIL